MMLNSTERRRMLYVMLIVQIAEACFTEGLIVQLAGEYFTSGLIAKSVGECFT